MTASAAPDAVVDVARNLREIATLNADLEGEAVNKSTDREIPGGDAMVMLAPVANLEAWQYLTDQALERWQNNAGPEPFIDDDDTWEPPLQTLLFWSEAWRVEHNAETDMRPTIDTEVQFLRGCLDWAWDHEPHFDDFAKDVRQARVRLENTLTAGIRPERARTVCMDCDLVRLVKHYGDTAAGDHWSCPRCRRRYSHDEFMRAQLAHLSSIGADRFVKVADGIAAIPRSENTVRTWINRLEARTVCNVATRERLVWWPDLRRLHLEKELRARRVA